MTIECYEDLPEASDEEVLEFLRIQIYDVLKGTGKNYKILIAAFNTIINDIRKRLHRKLEYNVCNICKHYGECDHQGAYKKDDKWCFEP